MPSPRLAPLVLVLVVFLAACAALPPDGAPAPLAVPSVRLTPCRRVPVTVVGEGSVSPRWQALLDSAAAHGDSLDLCQLRAAPPLPRTLQANT